MPDQAWTWSLDTTLVSRRGAHVPCMTDILAQLSKLGWPQHDLFGIELTLEETLSNAIRHGNKFDESKQVFVLCKVSPEQFWLQIRDEGEGFIPDQVPDCTTDENLEACGGRGLFLIRAYMNRVAYNDTGNCVTLEKTRTPAEADNLNQHDTPEE